MFKTSTPPTLAAKEAFRCDVCSRLRGHIKHITPGLSSEKNHDSATDLLYQLSLSVLGLVGDKNIFPLLDNDDCQSDAISWPRLGSRLIDFGDDMYLNLKLHEVTFFRYEMKRENLEKPKIHMYFIR